MILKECPECGSLECPNRTLIKGGLFFIDTCTLDTLSLSCSKCSYKIIWKMDTVIKEVSNYGPTIEENWLLIYEAWNEYSIECAPKRKRNSFWMTL